jgi:hypothetical protein
MIKTYYIAITLLILFAAISQEFNLISKFAWAILCLHLLFKLIFSGFKISSINPNYEEDFKYSPPEEWEKDEPWNQKNK